MRKRGLEYYLEKISQGVLISLGVLAVLLTVNKDSVLGQLCLYEIMPQYEIESRMKTLFKLNPGVPDVNKTEDLAVPAFNIDTTEYSGGDGLIGLEDDVFQPETDYSDENSQFGGDVFTIDNVDAMRDVSYLKQNFYIVDKRTDITSDLFNVDAFLSSDLRIDNAVEGPKILIFHTHSNEKFADSASESQGVIGVGELLCRTLEEKYDIQTLHNTQSFDMINGKSNVMGAYERMEPVIKGILRDNPSIQLVLDIHRDGVEDDVRLIEDINGKRTAKIMFFNGLSRLYEDGELVNIASLPNPNLETNLALSFNAQLTANSLYPGLARRVYLNAYRYSLHMLPKSMLIEVGAQTNTEEEARNAVEPLADILAHVMLG